MTDLNKYLNKIVRKIHMQNIMEKKKTKNLIFIKFQYLLSNKEKIFLDLNRVIFKYQRRCLQDVVFVRAMQKFEISQ